MITGAEAGAPHRTRYTSRWKHIHACRDMTDAALFALPPEKLQLSAPDAQHMLSYKKLYWEKPMFETLNVSAKQRSPNCMRGCAIFPDLSALIGKNIYMAGFTFNHDAIPKI